MNLKLIRTTCLLGLNFFAQFSRAEIPAVEMTCRSLNVTSQTQITGKFQEAQNRHGAGQIQFTIRRYATEMSRIGGAQSWAVDQIDYSDSSIQVTFMDAHYYSGNVSTLTINGVSESLICQFKQPVNPVCPPSCLRNHR